MGKKGHNDSKYAEHPGQAACRIRVKRRSSVRMPRFGAALGCLFGTQLILTLTNRMREMVKRNSTLKLVKAPQLRPFCSLTIWHPRLTTDARHIWLREAISQAFLSKHPSNISN
jgi:hypothetical protein